MKANFTSFPCYVGIKKDYMIQLDIAESLADIIYNNVAGISAHVLAEKIYKAKGEVDIDKNEVEILMKCRDMFTAAFADSLTAYFDKQSIDEEEKYQE